MIINTAFRFPKKKKKKYLKMLRDTCYQDECSGKFASK